MPNDRPGTPKRPGSKNGSRPVTPSFRTPPPPGWKSREMREHGLKLYKSMGLKNVKPDAVLDKKGAAGKGKSEQVRQEELEKFFAEQEELQDETRAAFVRYDKDNSGKIDCEELYNMLSELSAFSNVKEPERKEMCDKVLEENDQDKDGLIDFSEFSKLYNQLLEEKESKEALTYKVPSIFGRALDEAESMVVKAMKPMLDNSIFADRRKEAAAKDYFDVASLRDKMFKADWARIDKKKSFVEFKKKYELAKLEKETGKVKNQPLGNFFKKTLREEYDMLCNCFTYFCCRSDECNFTCMSFDDFKEFAYCAGLREKEDIKEGSKTAKSHIVDLRALFKEINELEATTNKAKKAENDANNENAFFRFEFLECVMRLSMQFQKSEDVKLTLQGYMLFIGNTLKREAPVACLDRNVFRKDRLYTRDVMEVFARFQRELKRIFTLATGDPLRDLSQQQFIWLAERCGLIDRHLQSPEGLHHDELRIIHVWSQMMVADEFKGMTQYTTLTFIEFMEALGRISDVKDLASHAELKEHHLVSVLDYVEKTEFNVFSKRAKPPPIQREVVSCLWDDQPKSQSLAERIEMLLDYMFLMFAPDCGSVVLGTYDINKFTEMIDQECIDIHGELLWPK